MASSQKYGLFFGCPRTEGPHDNMDPRGTTTSRSDHRSDVQLPGGGAVFTRDFKRPQEIQLQAEPTLENGGSWNGLRV